MWWSSCQMIMVEAKKSNIINLSFIMLTCFRITKNAFTFWLVSWILFNTSRWNVLGATLHVPYPTQSVPCLLMNWWLQEPGRQSAWYWPDNLEYSVISIKRVTWKFYWDQQNKQVAFYSKFGYHWVLGNAYNMTSHYPFTACKVFWCQLIRMPLLSHSMNSLPPSCANDFSIDVMWCAVICAMLCYYMICYDIM